MKDIFYAIIGRATLFFDIVRPLIASGSRKDSGDEFDRTGLVVAEPHPLDILCEEDGIIFPKYDSLAHSFWRSQEFSLFSRHRELFRRPMLDFGCGDGSFASVLFKEIDYGVDTDPEALKVAEKYGIYKSVLRSSDISIPLESGAVGSVFSNSVLEHLGELDGMLSDINRILVKGGKFIFTVPVDKFKLDLKKYFGKNAAEKINEEYFHKNLFETEAWKKKLAARGFSVETIISYQPDWFTFWYRMFRLFGNRGGLGRLFPDIGERVFRGYRSKIMSMIRSSVNETDSGGNIFVVAVKK